VAARYQEGGKLSEVVPSLHEGGHRLAVIAGTSTCHLVQVHISPTSLSLEAIINVQHCRVFKVSSLMVYGVPTRYIKPTVISFLVIDFNNLIGPSHQWMVDDRGRPIINWTGLLRVSFFYFLLTIIHS
jgi:hypothetical protein